MSCWRTSSRRRKEMAVTSSGAATVTLPTDRQILITREFDAPKHLAYEAFTTPELVKRWWHANRGEVTIAEIELQVGGMWRYESVTDDGSQAGSHGADAALLLIDRSVG